MIPFLRAHSSIWRVCDKGKGTAVSVLAYCRPERVPGGWGSQISRHWHMKVVRLSVLCTVHLYPPENIPGAHFFQGLSWPQGHCMACYIMSMKNFNDTIWNRTRNKLVVQSELTAPLCAPQFVIMLIELNTVRCLELNCLCSKTTTSCWEWTLPKTVVLCILHSCCFINK